ncbi:hypothetical protein AOLI_G00111750 [Acnodon oligacanthus]
MASPKSFHALVAAATFFTCLYLFAESGVLWAIQSLKASFFSLTASLTTGVHQGVLGLLPRQASFWPRLCLAASTMEVLNRVH